jgi:parallel beta-helix repeat protein
VNHTFVDCSIRLLLCVQTFTMCVLSASGFADEKAVPPASAIRILQPGENAPFIFQEALINAQPGDVIELAAGTYNFNTELNVACDNITIRGAGREQTILSFRSQAAGSSGIVATGDAFVIENLSVEDTVGNAIKVLGAKDVTFRNVRVEWTEGPKSTNGAYGIYPVECQNVLIENCISIGASDSGIYVGQSQDVIVRGCHAKQNVAGIEIENTLRADVFDNDVVDNTGGILVFDLPGLTLTNGGYVRVFRNRISNNNHKNFAPKGTIVADVPAGSGVMLMATDNVEVFDNDIIGHQTSNLLIVSFLITDRKINDPKYDPFPENISVHDNRVSGGGSKPAGTLGTLLSPATGGVFPEILFDGMLNPANFKDGKPTGGIPIRIRNNGDATFANLNVANFSEASFLSGKYKVLREIEPYSADLAPLKEALLTPHGKPASVGNPAAAVYRAAPKRLSAWGLFENSNGQWIPASDVLPYELITPLFSDYTFKHRAIRLPAGEQMTWHEAESLEFPVGTVITKTFAYPDETADQTPGERFVETRIEHREPTGWYGYSYIWAEDQSDATLSLGGGVVDVSWKNADETHLSNKYQIPNANQCLSCHGQDNKYVPLGTTARNLNRPAIDKNTANQLTHWTERGVLKGCPTPEHSTKLASFDDPKSGSLDERARAWLEVNCAHCHNPKGSARTSGLDLRSTQTDPGKFGVFKSPVAAGKGSGGRRYDIIPGKPNESILMYRLETEEPGARMPTLARNLIHSESNQLIREWIAAMKSDAASDKK